MCYESCFLFYSAYQNRNRIRAVSHERKKSDPA